MCGNRGTHVKTRRHFVTGLASYPHSGTSVRTLLAAAQEALKRAKENGRNRIEEAHPMMRSTG